jgi:RNA polymerase sigma-70 factor (ECF subfamily)
MLKEREIINRIRKGDIREFESLFRSYYTPLLNFGTSVLKDRDAAEEIVQELFYIIWRDREKLIITTSLKGYLFRSVYNRAMHHLDHIKVVRKHAAETDTGSSTDSNDPLEIMRYRELNSRVAKILDNLPERCAQIFCMSRFEGLKYNEIASQLAISVKTVEANMGRALKEFRKELLQQ